MKTLEFKYRDLVSTRPQLPKTIEELLNHYSDKLKLSPIQQLHFDELRNDLHSFIPTSTNYEVVKQFLSQVSEIVPKQGYDPSALEKLIGPINLKIVDLAAIKTLINKQI